MSVDDDFDFPESFSSISFKFKTIRIVDNIFTAFVNTLRSEVYINEEATDQEINIALEKIHFWFDQIVSNSIIFNRDNAFAMALMFDESGHVRTANIPMVLPDEPNDDFLAAMLHCKLNALGDGIINFGTIELTSDTRENLLVIFTGFGEMMLPNMEEWVGERAYHKLPWWCRNDGSTLDVIPSEDSDLLDPPEVGVDLGFIADRYRRKNSEVAMVIRPSFKPEVIPGGLDDKPKN